MPLPPTDDIQEQTAQLFAMLKSIGDFDQIEVRHIINTIVAGSERDSCFQLIYHRCVANIASLCTLTNRQHFQAISMITRSLFELAVDIKLIGVVPGSVPKMIGFIAVEKARSARKIIKFKADNPTSQVDDAIYLSFIAAEGARIDALKANLWPGVTRLDHWSGMNLRQRTDQLPLKYQENYEVQQPRLSWQVHSGLTGIANLKLETFTAICGVAIKSCADSYEDILLAIIDEYQIGKANDQIKWKLLSAKWAPFAKDPAEAEMIYRHLTR